MIIIREDEFQLLWFRFPFIKHRDQNPALYLRGKTTLNISKHSDEALGMKLSKLMPSRELRENSEQLVLLIAVFWNFEHISISFSFSPAEDYFNLSKPACSQNLAENVMKIACLGTLAFYTNCTPFYTRHS